jgi:pimeloyl-ACP methyl ester carboxylesterase
MGSVTAAAALAAAWGVVHLRAPAVHAWAPSRLDAVDGTRLHARVGGDTGRGMLLLHGLVSTGDVFGRAFDPLTASHRVVVPDLLGFGRSMDERRTTFTLDDHLDALDELADRTGLHAGPISIGAHSMGSALALRWAARHPDRVDAVVCWGAPMYPSPHAARTQLTGSAMARLIVLDTRWAEHACAISCRHRTAAGWLAAAIEPRLPIRLSRQVPLHTWPAYRDALNGLVVDADWRQLLTNLTRAGVPVRLVWGHRDHVGDVDWARNVAAGHADTSVELVDDADHLLPLTHPELCRAQLLTSMASPPTPTHEVH